MGRKARLKQGPPEPLILPKKPKQSTGFVRSGGKRKRIGEDGQLEEREKKKFSTDKGKKRKGSDEEDEEGDEEEDQGLASARA